MAKRIKSPEFIEIGHNIRRHREKQGVSRDKLAEMLGLSTSYVADVERGSVGISIKTLKLLCGVLQVSADALVNGTGAGIDAKLRGLNPQIIESIEKLVDLQLELLQK